MSKLIAMTTLPHKNAFRQEGNRLYQRAHNDGNSNYIRKVLLNKAIANYERALPSAINDEDEKVGCVSIQKIIKMYKD